MYELAARVWVTSGDPETGPVTAEMREEAMNKLIPVDATVAFKLDLARYVNLVMHDRDAL